MPHTTKLAQMVDPEVMQNIISAELEKAIRFSPLAEVDSTLVGRPGSTITFPAFTYIGDAEDVGEGQPIPLDQLGTKTREVTIKKAGKGVEITDEAVLSGLGDPVGEATRQLLMSIANKIDNDLLAEAKKATQTATGDLRTVDGLQGAIDIYSDEDDAQMIMLMNPVDAAALRADARKEMAGSDVGANALINGTFYEVLGVQIVRSNKLEVGEAYLVKQGAFKIVKKRDALVERERDIIKKTTVATADKPYGVYLFHDERVVKFVPGGE